MKRPSFQFYPADWRKDPALSSCSLLARGLWIELICVAHQSEKYGFLSVNGNAMTDVQIARMVGESPAIVTKLLKELGDAGVFSRTPSGCIYSRRMVADEHLRNVRASSGRLGGNPNLVNQNVKKNVNQKINQISNQCPTPSSSSSSSDNPPLPPPGDGPPGFAEFWRAWPQSDRKAAKGKCLDAWRKSKAESVAAQVLDHVGRLKSSDSWLKNNGEFVPAPLVYLNQRRWEGASESTSQNPTFAGAI